MLLIDRLAYTNNLTNISPQIKGSIGIIFLTISMITKNILFLLSIILLMSGFIVCIAKIDYKNYLKLIKIPMYFLIMGVTINIINISFDSTELLYSFSIFKFNIGISRESLMTSLHTLFRSISCLTCAYFFILTTPFNQIILLFKKCHVSDNVI
ncbi:MAG: CbiQ family ECF transporter T component, partial [Romboutsia sp.]|uniref:CbiQ family ECF transporter T component n=1 Tax=Romboutsia sp. TaxID=1965302 RepID=UPI003F34DAE6